MKYKDFYDHLLLEIDSGVVDWYSRYLKNYSYNTEQELRNDLRKHMVRVNDGLPEDLKSSLNKIEDEVYHMPIYKIGSKYKIGNRPKKKILSIKDFDIKWTGRDEISTSGLFSPMDIKSVEKKFINYKKINPTEGANPEHMDEIMEKIKDNGWIRSIVVDDMGNISDGHHRYDALVKMGIKEIPCSVVNTY